ncbi:MAG: flagellar motor switch protein FliM [Jatrophihabitantaceae bacterium]
MLPIARDVPMNPVRELRESARPRRGDSVVPYDFWRPSKLSREHIRMLQMAYETFARRMTTLLTSGLRQVCLVTLSEITQQSYEEYVTGLASQTLLAPISVPPLAGTGVLEFPLPIAQAAIDHMLGGPGGQQVARTLTDIETTLMRGLLEQMVATMRYSLEPIVTVTPSLGLIEYNPQFVQAASATDAVVVGEFDMTVGSERGRATLCLPLAALLPKLTAQRPREDDRDTLLAAESTARRLRDRLGDVPLDVSVHFAPVVLSPERILTLAAGDVLSLEHRVGKPLTVQAGGVTFGHAVAGKSGPRLAALIVDIPQEHA